MQHNTYQIPSLLDFKNDKLILNSYGNARDTEQSKRSGKKKNKAGLTLPDLKTYYKATYKTVRYRHKDIQINGV